MTSFSVGLMLVYRKAIDFSKLIAKPCYFAKVLATSQSSLVECVESLIRSRGRGDRIRDFWGCGDQKRR